MTDIRDRVDEATTGGAPPPRAWYAAAGATAAVAGAGLGHLVAALVAPPASPVAAVGDIVINATPTPVKEWAVASFGTADKTVLVSSVLVVTLVLAAGIGVLARAHRTSGLVLLLGLAALATAAGVTRPSAGSLSAVPGLVTAGVGLGVLAALARRLDQPAGPAVGPHEGRGLPPDPVDGSGPRPHPGGPAGAGGATRRTVLLVGGAAGAAGVAGGLLGTALTRRGAPAQVLPLPAAATPLPPLPAGLDAGIPGISPFRTPDADFYRIDTALILPRVDPADWTLTIDGAVDHEVTLTYAELTAMPLIEKDITLMCVSNEVGGDLVGSARWLGVPVREVLARAGIRASADQVLSTSVDGMTISTPVQALTDDRDALLAIGMNGAPLPTEHGFPVRLVTPGLYGFVGATKWLARMTATTYAAQQAYWTERGWATDAPCLTESRIDTPRDGSPVKAGTAVVGGVAWAQGRGITRVEVRVDEGPWQRAVLGPDAGIDYWRQWYLRWEASPGRHTLTARATDGLGDVQTVVVADPFPRGATGWPSIEVTVG